MLEVVATTPSKPLGACVTVDMRILTVQNGCCRRSGNAPVATHFYTPKTHNFPTPVACWAPAARRKLKGFGAPVNPVCNVGCHFIPAENPNETWTFSYLASGLPAWRLASPRRRGHVAVQR